jgi:hypothetical protein
MLSLLFEVSPSAYDPVIDPSCNCWVPPQGLLVVPWPARSTITLRPCARIETTADGAEHWSIDCEAPYGRDQAELVRSASEYRIDRTNYYAAFTHHITGQFTLGERTAGSFVYDLDGEQTTGMVVDAGHTAEGCAVGGFLYLSWPDTLGGNPTLTRHQLERFGSGCRQAPASIDEWQDAGP